MNVLSDTTLRKFIARNELIIDGDPAFANHCAYEFKPAKVVYGGMTPENRPLTIDLTDPKSSSASIPPTGVAWVRTRERVKIPKNMVGLWIQTNSLSRRGLLLLNSTLVEPGYEGYLSAHLANMGAEVVVLGPSQTIAKLVFFTLDDNASTLVHSGKYTEYDTFIDELAVRSNASFLRISELIPDLQSKIRTLVEEAHRGAEAGLKRLTKEADEQVKTAAKETTETMKQTLKDLEGKSLRRLGGGFLAGFALALAFLAWAFPYFRTVDAESRDRILEVVKRENERLVEKVTALQGEVGRLHEGTGQRPHRGGWEPANRYKQRLTRD